MRKKIFMAAIIFGLLPSLPSAAEKHKTAEDSLVTFEVVKDESGNLVLKQIPTTGQPMSDAMSMAEEAALKDFNDWYIVHDDRGDLQAIYGVLLGTRMPPDILATMAAGSTITRTDYLGMVSDAGIFDAGIFDLSDLVDPQAVVKTVEETLTLMVNAAREKVCGLPARPTEFRMDVEVQASIVVGASIKLGMTWNTQDLCG